MLPTWLAARLPQALRTIGLAICGLGLVFGPQGASAHPGEHRPGGARTIIERSGPSPLMRPDPSRQPALDLMVTDLAASIQRFADVLSSDQREKLFHALDAAQRTTSRDPSQTPAFCAVLAWCVPGWGLETGTLTFEQRLGFEEVMSAALGAGGYELVSAVRNRHQVIGLLEDRSSPALLDAAERLLPGQAFANLDQLVTALRAAGFEPTADELRRPSIGGLNAGAENWRWNAPGSGERRRQFESFAMAIFGRPGDPVWAIRVEGHHLSLNLTLLRDGSNWQVHATPLFLGVFPIVIPESLDNEPADPMTWQRGQASGVGIINHTKAFWQAVPEVARLAAWREPQGFPQRAPLNNETPTAAMLAALEIVPNAVGIARGPHMALSTRQLSGTARARLAALMDELLSTLHPVVAHMYRFRVAAALRQGRVLATWAGGSLLEPGSQHFSAIALGPFLIEVLQTPQYSVAAPGVPWANHMHVMLRDLRSPAWGDPLRDHLVGDRIHRSR